LGAGALYKARKTGRFRFVGSADWGEATRTIRERFGVKNASDYLVGEKLLTFARAADEDSEFAAELPCFQAAVREIFNPYELRGHVASLKPAARKKLRKFLYVSS
jgi:hypothetical protein